MVSYRRVRFEVKPCRCKGEKGVRCGPKEAPQVSLTQLWRNQGEVPEVLKEGSEPTGNAAAFMLTGTIEVPQKVACSQRRYTAARNRLTLLLARASTESGLVNST